MVSYEHAYAQVHTRNDDRRHQTTAFPGPLLRSLRWTSLTTCPTRKRRPQRLSRWQRRYGGLWGKKAVPPTQGAGAEGRVTLRMFAQVGVGCLCSSRWGSLIRAQERLNSSREQLKRPECST